MRAPVSPPALLIAVSDLKCHCKLALKLAVCLHSHYKSVVDRGSGALDRQRPSADADGKEPGPFFPANAARARTPPRLQHDRHRLAGARRFRPHAPRSPGQGPDEDGGERPRCRRLLRRRERPLHHRRLPGQLEEQHLHPLLRAAPRRRAGPLRDRRLRPRVRQDRRSLAGRQHPAGDHLEVVGDGRGDDGRQDGPVGQGRPRRERRREREGRHRHLRPERRRRLRARRPQDHQCLAGDVESPRRQDPGRARVPEDLLGDRRHLVLENRKRMAETGGEGELHHRQGQRVSLRAGLRFRLRHHRRLRGQHQPLPPLAHRQGDPRRRPRDRRPERGRPGRLLRRLRPHLQGAAAASGRSRKRTSTRSATSRCTRRSPR